MLPKKISMKRMMFNAMESDFEPVLSNNRRYGTPDLICGTDVSVADAT